MQTAEKIPLVQYTRGEEIVNTLTHAAGLVLSGLIVFSCVTPAMRAGNALSIVCALLYLTGTTAMFVTSALYHGVQKECYKRVLRLLDHCVIFSAVAGTATGCVPAVYATVGILPAFIMIAAAWIGAVAGLVLTLWNFEKTRTVRMTLYVTTAFVCAVSGGGAYKHLPKTAFYALLLGSTLLLIGAVLCGLGKKHRYMHAVFHLFIDAGLVIYYLGISNFCY